MRQIRPRAPCDRIMFGVFEHFRCLAENLGNGSSDKGYYVNLHSPSARRRRGRMGGMEVYIISSAVWGGGLRRSWRWGRRRGCWEECGGGRRLAARGGMEVCGGCAPGRVAPRPLAPREPPPDSNLAPRALGDNRRRGPGQGWPGASPGHEPCELGLDACWLVRHDWQAHAQPPRRRTARSVAESVAKRCGRGLWPWPSSVAEAVAKRCGRGHGRHDGPREMSDSTGTSR